MDQLELYTHSFIIRMWREQIGAQPDQDIWRGHITHIPSGTRRYLRSLDDMVLFIIDYIEPMNVKIALRWRLWRWLRYRTHPPRRD